MCVHTYMFIFKWCYTLWSGGTSPQTIWTIAIVLGCLSDPEVEIPHHLGLEGFELRLTWKPPPPRGLALIISECAMQATERK